MKLLLWGIGERCKKIINKGYIDISDVVAFVDSNKNKEIFFGREVCASKDVCELAKKVDYIVIANQYYGEIVVTIMNLGIGLEKVVLTDYVADNGLYEIMSKRLREVSASLYHNQGVFCKKCIGVNEIDMSDVPMLLKEHKFGGVEYQIDYFRYRTFLFSADEIKRNNVVGAIAELGVYRGVFASLIREAFPGRKFYLFDTFEGFSCEESKIEFEKGRCTKEFIERYKVTSKDVVLQKLKNRDNLIFCKGLFPDSVSAEAAEEKYAFVSLDVDFETSTYEGLQFFYPRLSENGMIFIHDYNSSHLHGVKNAVARYESENGITMKKIPLADICGTCVIVK